MKPKQWLWIACFFQASLLAAQPETLLTAANQAYSEGNYPQAIGLYDSLYQSGFESVALYYNWGNAYFKNGQLASAILQYERALKLDPDHEDALFNLRIANVRVVDNIEPVPDLLFTRWGKELLNSRSSSQWGILTVVSLWLTVFLAGLFLYVDQALLKRLTFFGGMLFLLCALTFAGLGFQRRALEQSDSHGVIFAENAYIKSAPSEESTDLFILHEGVKVEILKKENDWFRIRLEDGKVGWAPKATIEII